MSIDPYSLFTSMVISTFGLGFFIYGKRRVRLPHLVIGLALLVYPYFVDSVALMVAIAAACMGLLWLAVRAGL